MKPNWSYQPILMMLLILMMLPSCYEEMYGIEPPVGSTVIMVETQNQFQSIDNFGASDAWATQYVGLWDSSTGIQSREEIADLLFSVEKGIGLSAWRFNIGAGINTTTISDPWRTVETFLVSLDDGDGSGGYSYTYDWNRQAGQRWFVSAAQSRGVEQFIAFVNSPPFLMTKNGLTNCTVGGDNNNDGLVNGQDSTNLKEEFEDEFAAYLADILYYFKHQAPEEQRIPFKYISPINEPQWEWDGGQEGNRYSNEDMKAVLLTLNGELISRHLEVEIDAPDSGSIFNGMLYPASDMKLKYGEDYGEYIDFFFQDPDLSTIVGNKLCSHSYWTERIINPMPWEDLIATRETLSQKMEGYPNSKYWMTEYCVMQGSSQDHQGNGRDLTMTTALDVARMIHYDLTLANASAWQWWIALSRYDYKDGLIYVDPDTQTYEVSKTLWALGHYSRFIRPGAFRVECFTNSNSFHKQGLLASAYHNIDSKQVVVVIVNHSDHIEEIYLIVNKASQWMELTSFVTNDNKTMEEQPSHSNEIPVSIPAKSIVTILAE